MKKINCETLQTLLATCCKIDVRERSLALKTGVIFNSINVPLNHLSYRHVEDFKEVVVISSNNDDYGKASELLSKLTEKNSTKDVFWLDGGIQEWTKQNGELKPYLKQPFVKTFFEKVTATNQYVVIDDLTNSAFIIDPVLDFDKKSSKVSFDSAKDIISYVKQNNLNIEAIIETHVHADHLTSSQYLKQKIFEETGKNVPVAIGEKVSQVQEHFGKYFEIDKKEYENCFDRYFKIGEEFRLGSLDCKTIHTPGHTPDSLSFLIGNSLFAGDSIFLPDVGSARCDFPGGSAKQLFEALKERVFSLPPETICYVGHDYPPSDENDNPKREPQACTTIGDMVINNKHINRNTTFDEFVSWRQGRDATLGSPNLLYYAIQVNLRAGRLPGMDNCEFPFGKEWKQGFFKIPYKIAQ